MGKVSLAQYSRVASILWQKVLILILVFPKLFDVMGGTKTWSVTWHDPWKFWNSCRDELFWLDLNLYSILIDLWLLKPNSISLSKINGWNRSEIYFSAPKIYLNGFKWTAFVSMAHEISALTDETDRKFICTPLKFSWSVLNERSLFQRSSKLGPLK